LQNNDYDYFDKLENFETISSGKCVSFNRLNLFQTSLKSVNLNISIYQHLREIDLSHNFLSTFEILESLPQLVFLNLAHNKFTLKNKLDGSSFKITDNMFKTLTYLDLSHNSIDKLLDFSKLKELK